MGFFRPRPDKASLTGWIIGAASLAWGGFLVFRPNRIAPGAERTFFEALPIVWVLAASALWLALGSACLWGGQSGEAAAGEPDGWPGRRLRLALAGPLLLFTLWLAGHGASVMLAGRPSYARASLGPGFWGAVIGLLMPIADAVARREGRRLPLVAAFGLAAGAALLLLSGRLDALSVMAEYAARKDRFASETAAHVLMAGAATGAAALVGIPLGLAMHRRPRLGNRLLLPLNIVQTIPSLALFGLMIAPLSALSDRLPLLRAFGVQGVGWAPAVIALTLYGLLPVVRNTLAGFSSVDRAVIEAGLGMGMGRGRLLRRVELPLALPVVLGGVRVALVQNMGNAAVAALIGAGGLGAFIFQGLGQSAMDLVLLGALPTVGLAVLADVLMRAAIALAAPKGTRP